MSRRSSARWEYTQLFRSGAVEVVDTFLLSQGQGSLPASDYEERVIEAIQNCLVFFEELGLEAPIFVLLALLGIRGFSLDSLRISYTQTPVPLETDDLLFPDVVFENLDDDVPTVLRPIFDAVWQSFGIERCLNYNDEDTWNRP